MTTDKRNAVAETVEEVRITDLPPERMSADEESQVTGGGYGIGALITVTQQKVDNANSKALD